MHNRTYLIFDEEIFKNVILIFNNVTNEYFKSLLLYVYVYELIFGLSK